MKKTLLVLLAAGMVLAIGAGTPNQDGVKGFADSACKVAMKKPADFMDLFSMEFTIRLGASDDQWKQLEAMAKKEGKTVQQKFTEEAKKSMKKEKPAKTCAIVEARELACKDMYNMIAKTGDLPEKFNAKRIQDVANKIGIGKCGVVALKSDDEKDSGRFAAGEVRGKWKLLVLLKGK